jgi:hypothetical protein
VRCSRRSGPRWRIFSPATPIPATNFIVGRRRSSLLRNLLVQWRQLELILRTNHFYSLDRFEPLNCRAVGSPDNGPKPRQFPSDVQPFFFEGLRQLIQFHPLVFFDENYDAHIGHQWHLPGKDAYQIIQPNARLANRFGAKCDHAPMTESGD